MASPGTSISGSFLQQSLSKHRILIAAVAGVAIGCSLLYLASAQPTRAVRPLHRRNAVHRRIRPPANQPAELTSVEQVEDAREEESGVSDGVEGLANEVAETEVGISQPAPPSGASTLQELVYYIAEESSHQRAFVHRGTTCSGCGVTPIRGIRWRCSNCSSYDLCSDCEATTMHPKTHVFQKIKIPIPGLLWSEPSDSLYTGHGNGGPQPDLPKAVLRTLLESTKYEMDELQALFEEFLSIANVQWPSDPTGMKVAIDYNAFEQTWMPKTAHVKSRPNFLCDRLFAFYDSDNNQVIGFIEFAEGIAILRGKSRRPQNRIRIVFDAFDIDQDGYISRKDILRMFRGYYQLQKLIVLEELDQDLLSLMPAYSAKTIYSTRPLNSMLNSRQYASVQPIQVTKSPDMYSHQAMDASAIGEDSEEQDEGHGAAANNSNRIESSGISPEKTAIGKHLREELISLDHEETVLPETEDVQNARSGLEVNRSVAVTDQSGISSDETGTAEEGPKGHVPEDLVEDQSKNYPITGLIISKVGEPSTLKPPGNLFPASESRVARNGYSIPFHGTGLAKEAVYQKMQGSVDSFLDPLFKEKETLAIEVEKTKQEREEWHQSLNQRQLNKDVNKHVDQLSESEPKDLQNNDTANEKDVGSQDQRYTFLNDVENQIQRAGGPGRLNFEEFEQLMSIDDGKRFSFLASWLSLGNF